MESTVPLTSEGRQSGLIGKAWNGGNRSPHVIPLLYPIISSPQSPLNANISSFSSRFCHWEGFSNDICLFQEFHSTLDERARGEIELFGHLQHDHVQVPTLKINPNALSSNAPSDPSSNSSGLRLWYVHCMISGEMKLGLHPENYWDIILHTEAKQSVPAPLLDPNFIKSVTTLENQIKNVSANNLEAIRAFAQKLKEFFEEYGTVFCTGCLMGFKLVLTATYRTYNEQKDHYIKRMFDCAAKIKILSLVNDDGDERKELCHKAQEFNKIEFKNLFNNIDLYMELYGGSNTIPTGSTLPPIPSNISLWNELNCDVDLNREALSEFSNSMRPYLMKAAQSPTVQRYLYSPISDFFAIGIAPIVRDAIKQYHTDLTVSI